MQEIELTKQQAIDLQTQHQIKQESFDSLIVNQTNKLNPQHSDSNSCQSTSKKSDNRFQASLERQRNLLLNMEQQLANYPLNNNLISNETEDDKVMDYQVDSNNNSMPILLNCNKQSLPSINELKRINRSTNNFNQNGQFTNHFTNDQTSQLNDDNEFSRFVEDDYSRLSHTNASLYDTFELNQSIKMEDAFQDDKLDFKTSPTLAELNLNDDDMIDNLQTVNPNSVLCPSMPLQANKNGFLMGINYTKIGLTPNTSSLTTTTTADSQSANNRQDLVSSSKYNLTTDEQFPLNNNQFEQINGSNFNHLNASTNNKGSIKQEFSENCLSPNGFNARTANLSTNIFDQQIKLTGKASYNTRTRGRNKSQSEKQSTKSTRRTNQNNNNQQQQQNLSANNQVLCKLLNEKNDNLNNILLINNETAGFINGAINNGQSIPSRSAANLINSSQAICVSLANSSSPITNIQTSNKVISQLSPNDLLSNQLLNQQPIKCGLANNNNLRINNSTNRNRNSSISTEHSFSSSHDEGFISQAEEDSDEKDLNDDQMICDPKLLGNKRMAKTKRKRTRKDTDKDNGNLTEKESATNTSINRNLKKIKLEDNHLKPSTSTASGFTSTLSTVKEEFTTIATNKKDEKIGSKGRVNYKITKEKPILNDIQQHFKFDNNSKLELTKPSINDEKMDGESSDEDDDSFYGDYESSDLIGATTSDDQLNKWSLNMGRSRKNSAQRYFWQYNVQSKGPKGTKLTTMDNSLEGELPSAAVGSDLEPLDPVFSPNCMIEGVKHAGKARRGDGNDLTASPKKLLMIGLELKKLSKIINDLTPVAEVPVNNKSNSRKEKNKLASRACRLKKKAQHEANKIKLHGLTAEYKKYASIISEFKKIQEKVCEQPGKLGNSDKKLIDQLNAIIKEKGPIFSIAGQTTEFVNSVLDSVSDGNISGGLEKL